MHLEIKQANDRTEQVSSTCIDKLYNLSKNGLLDATSDLRGNINATSAYEDAVTFLNTMWGPNLVVTASAYYIRFADPEVEMVLKTALNKDESEGITTQEASSFALNKTFKNNSAITTFNELVYFKNGTGVFEGCSNLECIDISNATQIPDGMFYNCTKVTKFHGPNSEDKKIIINEGVTRLGQGAFWGLTNISFVLPTSVNYCGWGCFGINGQNVAAEIHLTDQNWLSQWMNIGGSGINLSTDTKIFVDGVEITQIDFAGFTTIGMGFSPMKSITSISNVDQLTTITGTFSNCVNLEIPDLNLPNLVSISSNGCFRNTKIQQISNLGHITTLPGSVFYGCSLLSKIVIPASLTSIGGSAFKDIAAGAQIHVPTVQMWLEVSKAGDAFNKLYYLYCNNTLVDSITIPSTMTSLTNGMLLYCGNQLNITIPQTVTSIGDYCFGAEVENNITIDNVNLPNLATLGKQAFKKSKIKSASNLGNITSISESCFESCTQLTSVTIPDTVTSITKQAFYGCSGLASINIPESVRSIDSDVFNLCKNISRIDITDLNKYFKIDFKNVNSSPSYPSQNDVYLYLNGTRVEGTVTLPTGMPNTTAKLASLKGITEVIIPSDVLIIGDNFAINNKDLTSINIPSSVTSISGHAFRNCSSLTSITIPSSVTSIEGSAFGNCHMNSIILNEGLLNIGSYAFSSNDIVSITIPSSVQTLSGNFGCVDRCSQLQSVIFLGTTPPSINQMALLYGVPNTCKIYVPDASMSAYEAALNVKNPDLINRLTPMSQLPTT